MTAKVSPVMTSPGVLPRRIWRTVESIPCMKCRPSRCYTTIGCPTVSRIQRTPKLNPTIALSQKFSPRHPFYLHARFATSQRQPTETIFTMAATKEYSLLCLENPLLGTCQTLDPVRNIAIAPHNNGIACPSSSVRCRNSCLSRYVDYGIILM